jgi:hypothetical protein
VFRGLFPQIRDRGPVIARRIAASGEASSMASKAQPRLESGNRFAAKIRRTPRLKSFITFRVISRVSRVFSTWALPPGLRLGDCPANRCERRAIIENDRFALTLDA